jgi:hypothetical protein
MEQELNTTNEYTCAVDTQGHASRFVSDKSAEEVKLYPDELSKSVDKICVKKLGRNSNFAWYPSNHMVYFGILGRHSYEQAFNGGTRIVNPQNIYGSSGFDAKVFEREMANQNTWMLDLTPSYNRLNVKVRNIVDNWGRL